MVHCRRAAPLAAVLSVLILFGARGFAQDLNSLPPSSSEQWNVFVDETESPLFPGASFFNATTSQLTRSAPHYGGEPGGYTKRFVASAVDDTVQNFFSDYVMASVLHEDTRYRREGPGHSFLTRVSHAALSGLVTRNFDGNRTINWSNITGSAIGAVVSNAYYPAVDRTARRAPEGFCCTCVQVSEARVDVVSNWPLWSICMNSIPIKTRRAL